VESFRLHGHRAALIDPLNKLQRDSVFALDPTRYGLGDPHKEYELDGIVWYDGTAFDPTLSTPVTSDLKWTLDRITSHLRDVYVGSIAYEYMHSPSKSERLWFAHLLESEDRQAREIRIKKEDKIRILNGLIKSEVMDTFLQDKFPNLKRYGLEGAESMIPALDTLFTSAASGS
jgi:probable 2-oxoglutarate dehydrogenase E1 component DHKTD1